MDTIGDQTLRTGNPAGKNLTRGQPEIDTDADEGAFLRSLLLVLGIELGIFN